MMRDEQLATLLDEMMSLQAEEDQCPEDQSLVDYILQESEALAARVVETHVRNCVSCQETVDDLRRTLKHFESRDAQLSRRLRARLSPIRMGVAALTKQQAQKVAQSLARMIVLMHEQMTQSLPARPPAFAYRSQEGAARVTARVLDPTGAEQDPAVFTVIRNDVDESGFLVFEFQTRDPRFSGREPSGYRLNVELEVGSFQLHLGDSAIGRDGRAALRAKLEAQVPLGVGTAAIPLAAISVWASQTD